jgi:hypothetical protein
MPLILISGDCELRLAEWHSAQRLWNQRASPSTTSRARSSCCAVSESRRPMTLRTLSRRNATILSVMICERSRSPLDDLASIVGRSGKLSWTSKEIGQTKMVVKSLNSSACTMTPGRGRPNSLGTTINTTSPRFTSTRSIVGRFDPSVDGVILRMSCHQLGLATQVCTDLRVAQVRNPVLHRSQPRRAQTSSARRHPLAGAARRTTSSLLRGGHAPNVTCYGEIAIAGSLLSCIRWPARVGQSVFLMVIQGLQKSFHQTPSLKPSF